MKKILRLRPFLTKKERGAITEAVGKAESKTSGEIKVLVVKKSSGKNEPDKKAAVEARAIQEFYQMGIDNTIGKTGVLVMISLAEKMVNVKADKAINEKVDSGTWDAIVDMIINGIRSSSQKDAICGAVSFIGNLLAENS